MQEKQDVKVNPNLVVGIMFASVLAVCLTVYAVVEVIAGC